MHVLSVSVFPHWAHLIAQGLKSNEVRRYAIKPGQWLAIVSTKKSNPYNLPTGLVALVWVSDCRRYTPEDSARAYYPYVPHHYLWVFSRIIVLPPHTDIVAQRGLFRIKLPQDYLERLSDF